MRLIFVQRSGVPNQQASHDKPKEINQAIDESGLPWDSANLRTVKNYLRQFPSELVLGLTRRLMVGALVNWQPPLHAPSHQRGGPIQQILAIQLSNT